MAKIKSTAARRVTCVRPAGDAHQVVTVEGGEPRGHCKRPCSDCPWRKDSVGTFPAEAFRHSAPTAYDMSDRVFACHQAGTQKTRACAGFLLRGAEHHLSVRIGRMSGRYGDVVDGGHLLFADYREMAEANGVDPEDPVLALCR
ncbi:MAG: DUF6283 family protein [Pseudomonas sp.]